jgi:Fe-S-cluster containining protein
MITSEEDWVKYLKQAEKILLPASTRGIGECCQCGYCCLGMTCIPKPDEINSIAVFLNLEVNTLINRYMIVDKFADSAFFLRWAKESQLDILGTLLPETRRYDTGYCILFDNKSKECRIYSKRPEEAKEFKCWDMKPAYTMNSAALSWQSNDIMKLIPDFDINSGFKKNHT